MRVIKRDGRIVKYNPDKIVLAVTKAMKSIGKVDESIAKSVADTVTNSLNGNKEISVEEIQDKVENALIKFGDAKLAKTYILYRAQRAQVRGFREAIGLEGDELKLGVNALALLDKRYLKSFDGKKETPSQMFRRVAKHVASVEKNYGSNPEYWSKVFYNLMANQMFLPNTPCLANAGNKDLNYLFACYAFEVGDSMEDILQTAKDCGMVQKTGGGVGLNISKLRPSGDKVKSTEGVASGPVDFMRIYDTISDVIKQGGIRRGGNLGLLLVNHPDIIEFVKCKNDETKLNNFNISVAITDEFMRCVETGEEFPLVNPKDGSVVTKVNPRHLFRFIAESAWRNGEPGFVFWDKIEKDNPTPKQGHLIKNLCGEQDLLPYEACCLGSINLDKFVEDGQIVYNSLRKVVHHSVRFLDDVIDSSNYPLDKINDRVHGNRKIGLGVMGFANMLFMLGIPYDSDEAVDIASDVMSFISNEAKKASARLAEDRGDFPTIGESVVKAPRRNATLTTIAPTGSISIIAETSSGIEPIFAIVYQKTNILENNTFFEVNPIFEDVAKREGWYSTALITKIIKNGGTVEGLPEVPDKWQKIFRTALEISPEWHIKMQAAFQNTVDNAISKTINMSNGATVEDVEQAILLGYKLGLKGLTVFRNQSRTKQVLETLCVECEDGVCPIVPPVEESN
jgi:ribonucleoside-diphosphate reductase alpha chain